MLGKQPFSAVLELEGQLGNKSTFSPLDFSCQESKLGKAKALNLLQRTFLPVNLYILREFNLTPVWSRGCATIETLSTSINNNKEKASLKSAIRHASALLKTFASLSMAKQQSNQRITRTQPLKATWPSSITNHTAINSSTIATPGQNHANRTFLKAHSKSGPFLEGLPALSSKRAMVPRQQVQRPELGTMKNTNDYSIVPGIQVPTTPEPTDLPIASSTDRTLWKVAERRRRIAALLEEIEQAEPLCDKPLLAHNLSFHKLVVSPSIKEYAFQCEPIEDFHTTKPVPRPASSSSNLPSPLPSLSQNFANNAAQTKRTIARSSSLSSISVPSTSQQPDKSRDTDRMDFVRLNSIAAKNVPVKVKPGRAKSKVAEAGTPHLHGQVPKYLERRKAEWAALEEEKLRNQPDPECPPGHMLMAESERLETLEMLQKSYDESVLEMNKMPVRNDTLRVRAKREELEQQMVKLEEGIRILSRPKVFVKLDN